MTHHHRPPSDVFDFEICVPVNQPIQPSGRVINGEIAGGRAAHTIYSGGYESLGEGWGELMAWIESQGLAVAPDLWEVYTVGPESGDESSKYRTELFRRLAS
jgi:effector-binding domain-containing protein